MSAAAEPSAPPPPSACESIVRFCSESQVGMFQVGRSSIPKPAPRNLQDLDSVQRVLLHRSVLGRGPRERPPSAPGAYGEGRGDFPGRERGGGVLSEQPYLGFSCVWCSLRQGVGTCTPPFPELDAPDPLSLAAGTLVRRGTGLSTHLQKTPLSKEVKQN